MDIPLTLQKVSNHIVTLIEPSSIYAEQFKNLRTHILSAGEKKSHRLFLITSAVRGEGKTVVAINLAISIAQGIEEKVLLLDCDLRQPKVHTMLGIDVKEGLADYLSNDIEFSDLLYKTDIGRLTLLGAGTPPPNPSELIGSEKMKRLIEEIKKRYEDHYIIIDSPPVLPITDSIILGSIVDSIILVVHAGQTPKDTINQALSLLNDKGDIMGILLNRVEKRTDGYYYVYGYPYSK
jgi:exopolysaccharide/PEP-CTERM locus tyrosine autokinase